MAKHKTPLLDELESGPWPSFVSDMKQQAEVRAKNEENIEFQIPVDVVDDLMGILELSFKQGRTHWKHGESSVFSVTAAVLSVAIATSRKNFRVSRISTPCASINPVENFTPPSI